ncbi:nuclear receptor-binding factor 2 [Lingula anatina]|uniref:Nuclear receptor-binding factor 2 n=1 Tax=Lingula anatina TaxID=7574 RepID=A0A1S3HAX3_LINAN|nr:nuclear receptor-binding factor 2 [Lingula anatina]|eukprot:XP_013383158.1 nuclear receptor-binding factor 2 [Lingula anatina]
MMDSPLNKAHRQERKAEALLRSGKFDEAVECHQQAAEYLLKAQSLTRVEKALESLQLQHDHHIKQKAVIRAKQRKAQLQKQQQMDSNDTTITNIASLSDNLPQMSGYSDMPTDVTGGQMEEETFKTMEETDSLLFFLHNRAISLGMDSPRPWPNRHLIQTAVKAPKDDKMIIEELKTHNLALRSHIEQLLGENANLHEELNNIKKENEELKTNNHIKPVYVDDENDEEERFYSIPPHMNLSDLPSLELPPLEMPLFDFDSIKAKMNSNSDT